MIILDTNIWYAVCDRSDSLHQKAQEIFSSLDSQVMIPEYVLVELMNLLVRKRGKVWTDKFMSELIVSDDCQITPNTPSFTLEVIQSFLKSDNPKLSFVDHSLLYLSKHHKVLTFDQELAKVL
jgi:predicted nucleic acid-binding protein